jgi:hypothetical protein
MGASLNERTQVILVGFNPSDRPLWSGLSDGDRKGGGLLHADELIRMTVPGNGRASARLSPQAVALLRRAYQCSRFGRSLKGSTAGGEGFGSTSANRTRSMAETAAGRSQPKHEAPGFEVQAQRQLPMSPKTALLQGARSFAAFSCPSGSTRRCSSI